MLEDGRLGEAGAGPGVRHVLGLMDNSAKQPFRHMTRILVARLNLPPTMLSIARTALRPTLARSYALRSAASLHTLPELPYAYNVRS